eukprot:jgi/Mesen1/9840/ME000070S09131
MDEFGDGYFEAVDDDDLRQVFASMDVSKLPVMDAQLAHYRTKDCATATWCLFQACHVFFAPPLHSTNPDSQALATLTLRRLSLELAMHGGSAAPALVPGVTHVVAYSLKEQPVPFGSLVSSLGERARELLSSPEVHVVAHDWLEDSCQARKQAPVAAYELRCGSCTAFSCRLQMRRGSNGGGEPEAGTLPACFLLLSGKLKMLVIVAVLTK